MRDCSWSPMAEGIAAARRSPHSTDCCAGESRPVPERTRAGRSGVRQAEVESRALVLGAIHPHLAAVTFDDAPDDRKPDACTLELVGGVQALEHAKQLVHVLHVEADAIVP